MKAAHPDAAKGASPGAWRKVLSTTLRRPRPCSLWQAWIVASTAGVGGWLSWKATYPCNPAAESGPLARLADLKNWWGDFRPILLAYLIHPIVPRRVFDGAGETRPRRFAWRRMGTEKIACLWHDVPSWPAFGRFWVGYWVIISHSRDGEMQTRMYRKLGFKLIRGSTGRGGVRAAVEAIKGAEKAPDWPSRPTAQRDRPASCKGRHLHGQESGRGPVPYGNLGASAHLGEVVGSIHGADSVRRGDDSP